jgi:hypothetical protein
MKPFKNSKPFFLMKTLFIIIFISGATTTLMAQHKPVHAKKSTVQYPTDAIKTKTADSVQVKALKTNADIRAIDSVLVMLMEEQEVLRKQIQKRLNIIDSLTKKYNSRLNVSGVNPDL